IGHTEHYDLQTELRQCLYTQLRGRMDERGRMNGQKVREIQIDSQTSNTVLGANNQSNVYENLGDSSRLYILPKSEVTGQYLYRCPVAIDKKWVCNWSVI